MKSSEKRQITLNVNDEDRIRIIKSLIDLNLQRNPDFSTDFDTMFYSLQLIKSLLPSEEEWKEFLTQKKEPAK